MRTGTVMTGVRCTVCAVWFNYKSCICMSKGLVFYRVFVILWLAVVTVGVFDVKRRGDSRVDALVREGDMLLERVKMMDESVRVRDSMLTEGIREGKERMEELAKLRSMTLVEVKKLEDSMKVDRVRFDSLSKSMLSW